jgi:uncharacterized membrane protein
MQKHETTPPVDTLGPANAERIIEQTVGIYRGGYILSFALIGIGLLIALVSDKEIATELGAPVEIIEHLVDLDPNGFFGLGIGFMILTPIVMSFEVAVNFLRARNSRFSLITGAVAAILVVTMALAFA